jgi:CspA family cold shock protein
VSYKQYGTVIWFKANLGYGFIKPDSQMDESDIFVHYSGIAMNGYKQLKAGDKVEYILSDTAKGIVATEVKLVEPSKQ